MAGKTELLPKNFKSIMERGNLEELKRVYDDCAITAHAGKKEDKWWLPFFFSTDCIEFYGWLVNQGLDIETRNPYGRTALYEAITEAHLEGLVLAGADIEARAGLDRIAPIHRFARFHNENLIKKLIALGADVNARDKSGNTPLDWVFFSGKGRDVVQICAVAKLFIESGGTYTEKTPKHVEELSRDFEFIKSSLRPEDQVRGEKCVQDLCGFFRVKGAKAINKNDGDSPIVISSTKYEDIVDEIFDSLVPPYGHCKILQGEVVRICCKVRDWLLIHEGEREQWREDYEYMMESIPQYLSNGTMLDSMKMEMVRKLANNVNYKSNPDILDELCKLCIEWVLVNPQPIIVKKVPYSL